MIKISYDKETGKIYAGNKTKKGFGQHYNEVTNDCLMSVLQYILDMRMTSDQNQEIETDVPILKRGKKPYKITLAGKRRSSPARRF